MIANQNTEQIKFEIYLTSEYYKNPPHAEIYINDSLKFSDDIRDRQKIITFWEKLNFDSQYSLKIIRSNADEKNYSINGKIANQCLYIDKIIIDNINCEWLLYSNSYAITDYPESYKKYQQERGLEIFDKSYNTTLIFNTEWYFNFTSPFYIFIMKCMGGGIY